MPMLQIDGVDVAEIDEVTARRLLKAREQGLGNTPDMVMPQRAIHFAMRPALPAKVALQVHLEFPAP